MIRLRNPEFTSVDAMRTFFIDYYGGSQSWIDKLSKMPERQIWAIYDRIYKLQNKISSSTQILNHGEIDKIEKSHKKATKFFYKRLRFTCPVCGCAFEVDKDDLTLRRKNFFFDDSISYMYISLCPECLSRVECFDI